MTGNLSVLERVSLHQVEVFCAVMEAGGFARAAERLLIGQPSVSIQIRRLEEGLGLKLFTRTGRSTHPTEAANAFYGSAQLLLKARGDLARAVEDLKSGVAGSLSVGAGTTIGDYLLPELLGEWRRTYPNVDLAARVANTRQVVKWLLEDSINVAFLGERVDAPDLEFRPWLGDQIVVLVPTRSRLAVGRHPVEELRTERFVMRERGSATRAAAEACLVAAGVSPAVTMTLGSNEAVKRAVAADLGITMLSQYSADLEIRSGQLAMAHIDGLDCKRMLFLAWDGRRTQSRLVERFVVFASNWARDRGRRQAGANGGAGQAVRKDRR
jgi:DNA-binding transcriptional LysR family regulator